MLVIKSIPLVTASLPRPGQLLKRDRHVDFGTGIVVIFVAELQVINLKHLADFFYSSSFLLMNIMILTVPTRAPSVSARTHRPYPAAVAPQRFHSSATDVKRASVICHRT